MQHTGVEDRDLAIVALPEVLPLVFRELWRLAILFVLVFGIHVDGRDVMGNQESRNLK
jgi:hypothetical protein